MRHQRVLALALAATVSTGGAALAAAGSSAAGGAWVATRTQAIHLSSPVLGATPAGERLTVSVALPLHDRAALDRLIVDQTTPGSASYRQFLTPAQVRARFGPTAEQVATVEAYLRAQGFSSISAEPNGLLVDATATVAQAAHAFHTTLSDYRVAGKVVHVNSSPAQVPAALAGDVTAVLGLADLPMSLPIRAAGSPDLSGFSPQAVAKAYDASKLPAATATSVAVVTGGDPAPIISNLRTAEKRFKTPQVPVTVVYGATQALDGADNPLTGNAEWDLDTQASTMVSGAVKRLYMYDVSTFTDPEVARAFNLFVAQDKAVGLSASLGECDYIAFLDGAMVATDDALAEGAAQGQSSFASTGDNGYACPEVISTGAPEGPPGVSWPSVGEYTTAVGGTTLLADSSGTVSNEIGWVASGGGISPWETAPSWTLRANVAGQSWQETNQGGRAVPDVDAIADSLTPYTVWTGPSTSEGVGGTSVSSPVVLGLWARIENARGGRLGLAAADFYRLYNKVNPGTIVTEDLAVYVPTPNPAPVRGFRDITVGDNGVWSAKPGWDNDSGIGALDAAALVKAL